MLLKREKREREREERKKERKKGRKERKGKMSWKESICRSLVATAIDPVDIY